MARRLMIALIGLLVAQTSAMAQPKDAPAKDPAPAPAPAAAAKAPAAPSTFPSLPNAAVSIPWDELRQLIDRGAAEKAEKPPVDFVFSPATYTAAVGDKGVSVTAEATVTLLRDGWVLVPLGPSDAGVTKVTADAEAAPVVVRDGGLFALLNGGGKKKLVVTAERQTIAEGGRTRFEQPLLPAALVTMNATVPGTALDVQANGASSSQVTEEKNQTSITAAYRGGATASIAWKQRPIALKEADARVSAETQTLVTIEKGLMRSEAHVHVTIERAPIKTLQINIDPKSVVLSVSGKDVGRWTEAAGNAANPGRSVNIEFGSAVEGDRAIEIVYERDVPEDGGDVQVAPVVVKGARRDRGTVSVATRGGYEVRPGDASAAERISVSELPEWLRNVPKESAVQVGYRYAVAGAKVTLALEKEKQQEAKIFASTSTRIAVDRGVLRCRAEVTYEILHAGIDTLRVGLPAGAEITHTSGASIRNTQVVEEKNEVRTLVVGLKDLAKDKYQLTIDYDVRFEEAAQGKEGKKPAKEDAKANPPAVADAAVHAQPQISLITNPDASQDRGFVGIEVRGGYELTPEVQGAERVDVKELPQDLWQMARSPLMFGYRYDTKNATITLSMLRHQDIDVLIAMSDICEATTTYTPDGKSITKMMFVTRNNLKPFMTLKLPEGAQLWSAFVDDRPVTPSTGKAGSVLIPLKKSEDVEEDDQESYKAKREERRKNPGDQLHAQMLRQARAGEQDEIRDLKPYDVEIVFVMPAVKFQEKGDLKAALPQSDVPIGQLSWAICLPKTFRVLEAEGNLSEVAKFTLPFRHFADAEQIRHSEQLQKLAQLQARVAEQAAQQAAADQAQALADASKAKGVLPVRIEIPVVGEIHRFEKFLTVDEAPQLSLLYSRKLTE